jgi:sporulation protein YlmC with PRC-barrel domain
MQALKLVRLIGAMTVVASAPVVLAFAAHAQAPAPSDAPATVRPEMPTTKPGALPDGAGRPVAPPAADQKPTAGPAARTPTAPDQSATDAKRDPLVGLAVFGADGQKIGEVRDVKASADGKVEAIHVKTGGFLGFGGKTVAIPNGKFTRSGQAVQIAMTAADVTKLPVVEDKQG